MTTDETVRAIADFVRDENNRPFVDDGDLGTHVSLDYLADEIERRYLSGTDVGRCKLRVFRDGRWWACTKEHDHENHTTALAEEDR